MQTPRHAAHYPNPPDRFIFDKAVAPIFPSMAERSIPNYHAAHRMHAQIVASYFVHNELSVLDIGASRAGFFQHLLAEIEAMKVPMPRQPRFRATDISEDMCKHMSADFPFIEVAVEDIRSDAFLNSTEQFDVVNCTYVIQFIPPAEQAKVLAKVASLVKPKGVLFLGQKNSLDSLLGALLHDEYIRFRLQHGYSQDEIRAKTEALKNSMWPIDHDAMREQLSQLGFTQIADTTRSGIFSTTVCMR